MKNIDRKKVIINSIIFVAILILIPIVIGLPFTLAFGNKEILEVSFAVFGLLELLVLMIMIQIKSRRLYKNNMSNKDFKETTKYLQYKRVFYILLSTASINLLFSLLYFYIFIF